jgi:starch phosphorylase
MNPRRYLPRSLPKEVEALVPLALDLRWSWSHDADQLWRRIDAPLWEATQNPWLILETVSSRRFESLAHDREFRDALGKVAATREAYLRRKTWFSSSGASLRRVAFFSMEFGLGEALALYSGGLGVLAGDYLKSASDLGAPVVGVGLLYQQGYFRQALDSHGEQLAFNPYNAPTMLPVLPLRDAEGEWAHVVVEMPGRKVYLRAWEVLIGQVKLYLLDSNDPLNSPRDRGITAELYAAGQELRLQQEIVLGLGGWQLLDKIGDEIDVCHLNEGHAALAILARALAFKRAVGCGFDEALWCTRAGNLFTTHTPVAAGFDRFEPSLVEQYLGGYRNDLGLAPGELLALGRANPADDRELFNMAYLAVRGSAKVNGVSALHGEVSRRIFEPLFPRWPELEIPVSHVTNGIHVPSWEGPPAVEVWRRACGAERWRSPLEDGAARLAEISNEDLWRMRGAGRRALVDYARARWSEQRSARGLGFGDGREVLDPDALTLGFARRFATYKRPTLLLTDPGRLTRLLLDGHRPVQIVVAGKAHPADGPGRALVRAWAEFVERPEIRGHVVFLEDYDLRMAQELVSGVDLWLNTPRRPSEASGTSGMKVLANGGLNLSQLDGWWPEAYTPSVGWAIGDGREHDPSYDLADADQIYRLLENEIVPLFYERDAAGIPTGWIARVRQSMTSLTHRFSTHRMLADYIERFYVAQAAAFRKRAASGAGLARELAAWEHRIASHWDRVRFADVTSRQQGERHAFSVQVYLGELPPEMVRVELYADGRRGAEPACVPMTARGPLVGAESGVVYGAEVPADRPAEDYTPRVRPFHPAAELPIENGRVTWAR